MDDDDTGQFTIADEPRDPSIAATVGPVTARYLDTRAAESFKRQTDLEESIWRSLPFLTGVLIAAGPVVTNAALGLPTFALRTFPVVTYGLLSLSTLAFLAAFLWVCVMIWPRDFDYPPDDVAIADYATEMGLFHADGGMAGDDLDTKVAYELSVFMASTFATGATSALANNRKRLSARNQVLFFLLGGFLLAFSSEAFILSSRLIARAAQDGGGSRGNQIRPSPVDRRVGFGETQAPDTPADAGRPRRRLADQVQHDGAHPRQGRLGGGQGQAGKAHAPAARADGAP